MVRYRYTAFAIPAILALTLAACGGGSSTAATVTSSAAAPTPGPSLTALVSALASHDIEAVRPLLHLRDIACGVTAGTMLPPPCPANIPPGTNVPALPVQGCADAWAAGDLLAGYLANTIDAPATVYGAFRQDGVHTVDDLPVDDQVIVALPPRKPDSPTARLVLMSAGKIVQLTVPCTSETPQSLTADVTTGQWTIRPD